MIAERCTGSDTNTLLHNIVGHEHMSVGMADIVNTSEIGCLVVVWIRGGGCTGPRFAGLSKFLGLQLGKGCGGKRLVVGIR